MKLTKSKRIWVDNKFTKYCEVLQIEKPNILLTRKEYELFKIQLREKINYQYTRVGRCVSNVLGVCHRKDNTIFINVKAEPNCKRLDQTIRHELIHYAKPSYNHCSENFDDRMKRLLNGSIKNGRFC